MIIGQMYLNKLDRLEIDGNELQCGDCLQVLIYDGIDNTAKWIDTSIEYDGDNYYLAGLLGYNPIGLFGRIEK